MVWEGGMSESRKQAKTDKTAKKQTKQPKTDKTAKNRPKQLSS
jgi:hypothetical protein